MYFPGVKNEGSFSVTLYVLMLICVVRFSSICYAHMGEEHAHQENNDSDQVTTNDATKIQPTHNGLFVAKHLQTHLGMKTEKVVEKSISDSVRLVGHVISDPSGYARLQATQNARILNDPEYLLPLTGQKVKKDQVLLVLQPTLQKIETSTQRETLYKVESEIEQLKKEVNRKERLGEFASQKELENARVELERALKQKEEIVNKTFKPEYLKSPIDGIVADLHVRPGEIVTPEKTILEIVDPSKFLVEAYAFNPSIAHEITSGDLKLPLIQNKSIPLTVLGVSPKVNIEDQSMHILFKPTEQDTNIKLDMAVEVLAHLKANKSAIVVPRSAIAQDSNETWVFIRTSPEMFEARKVKIRHYVGNNAEIEEGLMLGEVIVVDGAYLLNQAK